MSGSPSAGHAVRASVLAWLSGLDADQRAFASFGFDDPERFVWAYTPDPPRRGLSLGDMRPVQRTAALAIVEASLSQRAAVEVRAIIDLEPILGALEAAAGRGDTERRDPGRYWFAVFGDPTGPAPWSWRVGGHHVTIHIAVAEGRIIGATPSFLGANPVVVPSGPAAGRRTLAAEEALARSLLATLTPDDRRVAVVDAVAPLDILTANASRVGAHRVPTGLRHDRMAPAARAALEILVRHYLGRGRDEIEAAAWASVVEDGVGELSFAWAGPDEPGRGHYYAVQGPRLLIEYDNTQDGANHIHSVWRDPTNDWGEDVLAAHYRAAHRDNR